MALMVSFLVFVAIQLQHVSQGQKFPFCQDNTWPYHGPKLPSLPNAFTAHVKANIVNKNYSMLLTEYYDKDSNKGAIKTIRKSRSSYSIYNYNYNEMMAIDLKNKTCVMQDIQTMHGHPFFGRNSSRIEGIADLFRFGAQFNETFLGNTDVRGIPCFHWQACINHNHHSYFIDYYFSVPDWSMPNMANTQVVRATINGTSNQINHHGIPMNKTRSFYHVYDFFDFIPGKPSPGVFQLPNGIFCEGMKDRKKMPLMPPVFSVELESVNYFNKSIMHFKEHYDFHRKLVMFQYHDYFHNKTFGPVRIIHDFHHGVKYNISGYVCQNVSLLTKANTRWDGKETKDHHLEMMSPAEMMFMKNKSALIYKGTDTVRGIAANVWIMKKESVYRKMPITTEYFFSGPSWNMRAGSLKEQFQVLLKTNTYGPYMNLINTMNVLNFDAEKVPLYTFSIGACYAGERNFISLRFLGAWEKLVYKQEMQFNLAVRNAVVQATNISAIRVDELKIGEAKDGIGVWFTLLDKPPATPPDSPPENDLKQAVEALKKIVRAGDLIARWKSPVHGSSMLTVADKNYFSNSMTTKPTVSPNGDSKKLSKVRKGVPPGAVAGVAFLMTAVGLLIGLGIAHVIMKRRGLSLFQYQRQE